MKGQFTMTNLLMVFMVIILFTVLAPLLQNTFIADAASALNATPNDTTSATVGLMQFVPFIILIAIILTAIYYANPRQEPY